MTPRSLPHNIEAEQAVLCAIIINAEYALPRAKAILAPSDFHLDRNRIIFEALCTGIPADLVSIKQALTDTSLLDQAGGEEYIKSLIFAATTSAGVEAKLLGVDLPLGKNVTAEISKETWNFYAPDSEACKNLSGN